MAGTPSYIQMPVDGVGKQVQAWSNSISGNTVYAEAVVIVDSTGTEKATAGNPLRIDPTGTTVQPVLDGASSATASAVPADASYVGFNSSGNLVGVSSVNPLPVTGGGGTQYTDETAESAGAFTITVAGMYNGTQVVGLRSDASDNLFVNLKTALPAGSNLIGSVTALGAAASGSAVTGNPILVGGSDGTDVRYIATDTSGKLIVTVDGVVGQVEIVGNSGEILDQGNGGPFSGHAIMVGGFDGTDLRFLSTDNTGQLKVLIENTPAVTGSGVFEVSPTTSANTKTNAFFTEISDGTNTVTTNSTTYTSKYGLDVNLLGALGTAFTTAGVINIQGVASGTVVPTVVTAATSGGATPKGYHVSSNAVQAIKSSAGQLYGYFLDNSANAATTYFQFFNVASGSVSLGSTASLFVIPVPPNSAANLSMTEGWAFGTAMSFAATTTYNGSTAPSSAVDCTIAYD